LLLKSKVSNKKIKNGTSHECGRREYHLNPDFFLDRGLSETERRYNDKNETKKTDKILVAIINNSSISYLNFPATAQSVP
jgi:hypothetical protein